MVTDTQSGRQRYGNRQKSKTIRQTRKGIEIDAEKGRGINESNAKTNSKIRGKTDICRERRGEACFEVQIAICKCVHAHALRENTHYVNRERYWTQRRNIPRQGRGVIMDWQVKARVGQTKRSEHGQTEHYIIIHFRHDEYGC